MRNIGVVGLGYVGLPLAIAFARLNKVIGFDTNPVRVEEVRRGIDRNCELSLDEVQCLKDIKFTCQINDLEECSVYIVTVPTPVDSANRPDFNPLETACRSIGGILSREDLVIFESTVYPGATEEICVPILESMSGLKLNVDFYCGYSPERINPGDPNRTISDIRKLTSGSCVRAAHEVDELYKSIIGAGTFLTSSIRVAEAAKVIENIQRDLNIALVNELSLIFGKLNLDTIEVLEAAGTKWNFIPFRPGLVGGHCIGVDPYYLTHKASEVGHHAELILAGRRLNDGMAEHVAKETIRLMLGLGIEVLHSKVLVLGIAFKENCSDIRNSKVVNLVHVLRDHSIEVDIYDPLIKPIDVSDAYGFRCLESDPESAMYDGIVIAVGHQVFLDIGYETIRGWGKDKLCLYDVKSIFKKSQSNGRL